MHIFEPLNVRVVTGQTGGVLLKENGFVLAVPDVEPENQLLLSGRSHGNRLFNREDVRLASFILTLARKSAGIREAQERGATLERERIARDLHDDVAPQLLTLAHTAESRENAGRARAALQTLRESIYALSDPRKSPLETVLAEWRVEVADRLEAVAGVRLSWQQPEQLPELALSSRQRLNLSRVLREALSNALRHGHPVLLSVVIALTDGRLTLRLSHDGYVAPPETWRPGKGISNMRSRVAELGGEIEWHLAQPGSHLVVSWDVPLVALDALAVTST
jgi:signal transduction histidine kinase